MSTARRDFLKHAGLTASGLAVFPTVAMAGRRADAPISSATLLAQITEVDQQQAEQWDTTWTKKITGTHKAMFDIPEVEGGVGVLRSGIWQRQFTEVLKVPAGGLSSVMVIRHNAIFLAMNQDFWTTYGVGEAEKLKDDDGKTLVHNPVVPVPGKDVPATFRAYMLDKQIEAGAIALGCGLAFRSVVGMIQQKDKLDATESRKKAMSMLIPGVVMQPSGIFANVLAQQAGCVFVQAV
jgi:hypothetical protein